MRSPLDNVERAGSYSGCLLGGAVGDALGWPVEFLSLAEIRRKFGPEGIRDLAETPEGVGAVTDDTQMSLFTAEGLLRELRISQDSGTVPVYPRAVYRAYLRWLSTQGESSRDPDFASFLDGELLEVGELHHRRAPGSTCLSALISGKMGTVGRPVNSSKGCGGVMRAAPVGLFCASLPDVTNDAMAAERAFELGCDIAAITHGHPLGYLPAGFLAAIVVYIVSGRGLEKAIADTLVLLAARTEREKSVLAAEVDHALRQKGNKGSSPEMVERFGGGWVGDEALALSIYCALAAEGDFARGVRLAVNHSGDSDSTGSITGNILGALLGKGKIPGEWLEKLELRGVIEKTALELLG